MAKNGPKLKEAAEMPEPSGERPARGVDADGFPIYRAPPEGGVGTFVMNGHGRMTGVRATMQALVNEIMRMNELFMRLQVGPITDDTESKGKYNFVLEFSVPRPNLPPADQPPDNSEPFPNLIDALQSQLGLRLEQKRGPLEVIVIDHVEKRPTEN